MLTTLFSVRKGTEVVEEGYIESEDEDNEVLDALGPIERHNIFSKFHNAMVGHFGVERTLKAMAKGGQGWREMRLDVTEWINKCGICQEIKYRRDPHWEDEYERH
jgi:Integrase zinc binding domain